MIKFILMVLKLLSVAATVTIIFSMVPKALLPNSTAAVAMTRSEMPVQQMY